MHLRLCGFPAMAPALTEAASQAESFKLPYTSPASVDNAPISLVDDIKAARKRLLLKRVNHAGADEHEGVAKCAMSSGEAMGMQKTTSKRLEHVTSRGQTSLEGPSKSGNRLEDLRERNCALKRRAECLMRVVLKLQGRQLEKEILTELGVLVEHHHTTLQLPSRRERLQQGLKAVIANSGGNVNNSDLKAEILQCEDVKNLSTAALVNLVRKLESTHGSPHRQKYVTLQHLRSVDKVENASTGVKLPEKLCKEMERVAATLKGNVRHVEKAVDSDATESSSGGESCDELEGYDEKRVHSVAINKRAAWKWAMDRSAVACRWTWLQAQVSDLEYRIRQQNETYRKLRANKRPVQLEPPTTTTTHTPSRLGTPDSKTPQQTNNSRVNGFVENENEETASRTRPLKQLRKRKIVHAHALYRRSEKAAKLSSVRCNCASVPVVPCVMCGGRVNNTLNVETDAMPVEERVALLDPSFHSVLSFEKDVVTHLRFEALINGADWHRVGQKQKVAGAARKRGHLGVGASSDVHKRSRKLKKNAAATLTAKLKKKLNGEKRSRGRSGSLPLNKVGRGDRIQKKRAFSHMSLAMKKQRERNLSGSSGSSSKPASPVPSLGDNSMSSMDHKEHARKSTMMHELIRRRRGESAFDINNIVIPYSMAASTRVERLHYKEILTPKWRLADEIEKEEVVVPVVPKDNGLVSVKSEDEPVEDLSDELFDVRHTKCEREEKKRYLGYVNMPHPHGHLGGRGRPRNMRTDSRCSSGANTPDPMSPYPTETHDSPITTPPSTPAPGPQGLQGPQTLETAENLISIARRRTTSLTRRDRSTEDFRPGTPEVDQDPVSPWDKRTFPLDDEEMDLMVKISEQTPPGTPPRRRSSTEEAPPPAPTVEEKEKAPEAGAGAPATPNSGSSTSVVGDDPNDPEWTVSTMAGERGPRPGIVIKLAKR